MKNSAGSSMVFTLLILFALMALGVAGLSGAASSLQISNNYRTGTQALEAAEAGVIHSVKVMNNAAPARMDTDIYNNWNSLYGTSARTLISSVTYAVTPTSPDPLRGAPRTNMQITSVGTAPGQSSRTIVAHVMMTPCGAIDMPSSGLSTTFNGNRFLIDGNDYLVTGSCGAGNGNGNGNSSCLNPAGSAILGISTRTTSDVTGIVGSLSSGQYDNVVGLSADQPASVGTCQGPTPSDISNTYEPRILAAAGGSVINNPAVNGSPTFGSLNSPIVMHFDSSIDIRGNVTGYGILVVDGGLTVSGSLAWTGLVLVNGTTQFTNINGNSTIMGALTTTDLNLNVNGSASVSYSSQALDIANGIAANQNLVPKHVGVVAWSQS